jgi:hypothetical protein
MSDESTNDKSYKPLVIDLVDTDEEGQNEEDKKRPYCTTLQDDEDPDDSQKKHRANVTSASQSERTTRQESPIKLLATLNDIEQRQKHSSDNDKKRHPSWTQCKTLRELLGFDGDDGGNRIEWILISNYIIDFNFLLNEVPELLSVPCVTVFFGCEETSGEIWKQAAAENTVDLVALRPRDPPGSPSNPLTQSIPYGVHHSKIFLVGFANDTLRVIIQTANLRYSDIHLMAQAAYFVSSDQSVRFDSIRSLVWLCFPAEFRVKSITDVWHF